VSGVLEAAIWGLIAGSALVIGAVIGIWAHVPRRVVALVMGFGAGALISSLAFDLTSEAFEQGGTAPTAIGLAAGGLTFFVGDLLIERAAARGDRDTPASGGPAIVLGALLDGIPESIVLGASLIGGLGVSTSFLAAVFASNLPEGLAGARDLRDDGHSPAWIIGLWVLVAVASALAAGLGYAALGDMAAGPAAVIQAFAAGAILAMLADSMMPEAFEHGGIGVGLATVFGFAIAFFLSAAPG
jgi:ZIP family zinc transporter